MAGYNKNNIAIHDNYYLPNNNYQNDTIILNHSDILRDYYYEISETFDKIGGIVPDLSNLYANQDWRYCKTKRPKDKGKIGYRCEFGFAHNKPFVKIIVHSFSHGGESATFNSLSQTQQKIIVKKQIPISLLQNKESSEKTKKEALFLGLLKQWHQGTNDVLSHSYVLRKNILYTAPLKRMGDKLGYLIRNIGGDVCGIQLIYPNGDKRIYGTKKGGFATLGNIEDAEQLYLCEGYATGNALYQLSSNKKKFAVIVCLDCNNVLTVAQLLKKKYPTKKLIVCPDNDESTAARGHGNPGLLQGYHAAIATYSEIRIPNAEFGSDWCDWWLAMPDEASIAFNQKNPIQLQEFALARLQQFKPQASEWSVTKALFQTFKFMIHDYPIKKSEETILDTVIASVQQTSISPKIIDSVWRRVKKRRFAMALRAKSFSRDNTDNITTIDCESIDQIVTRIAELKQNHPKAVFVTNAPMGTGKTQLLMRPEFMAAENKVCLPLVITPMRSLTKGVAERFAAFHYHQDAHEMNHQETLPASLAITINSIIKPLYQTFFSYCRMVFIDEYTQILQSLTMGKVENHQRQATENKLAELITQATYTYVADADFNQVALDHLQAIVTPHVPIFVFTMNQTSKMSTITYRYHDYGSTRLAPTALQQEIMSALEQDEKLYIVADSKSQINTLEAVLHKHKINFLSITADTVNFANSQEFLNNPDLFLEKHQPTVVLASPAVQSGISIELEYFNKVFGIYTGTVTPVVFQQMLHRVRAQQVFDLVLPSQYANNTYELQNPTCLLMAAYQQHMAQFGIKHAVFDAKTGVTHIGHLELKEEGGKLLVSGDPMYQRYETLAANLLALDNQQKQYAAQFLVLQAQARGITHEFVRHKLNELEKEMVKLSREGLKNELKTTKYLQVSGKDTLNDEQYQQLQYKGAKNADEVNALARHDIAIQLHLSEVTPQDIEFFDTQGAHAVANYQALQKGLINAQELDEKDKNKGVAKTNARWRKVKVRLLELIFNTLDLDIGSGDGIYGNEQAQLARQRIIDDEELSRYVLYKLKLKASSALADVAFINKLIKKLLGLKINRLMIREGDERYWVYMLNLESFARLQQYSQYLVKVPDVIALTCHQK